MSSEAKPQTGKNGGSFASLDCYYFCPAAGRALALTEEQFDSSVKTSGRQGS